MAPDVIDLISSSPCPLDQPQQPQQPPPAAAQQGRRSKRPIPPPAAASALFLSDDCFDTADDDLFRVDTRSNKRLRLSTSPPAARAPQPSLHNITATRPDFDPIEFTSSIDPEKPENQHHGRSHFSTATSRLFEPATTSAQLALSSDPFASSPPRPSTRISRNPAKKAVVDKFSDPFASSSPPPPPPLCPSKAPDPTPKPRPLEYSDPFASSPAPVQSVKPPAERRAISFDVAKHRHSRCRNDWDPISSSAPQPSSPPKNTAPAVINIDSDSENDSDDEEFPEIANFDVTKCRPSPRSPLRRSQSDIVSSKSRLRPTNTTVKKTTEQRARDREAQTAAKKAEKESKLQEKEKIKEAKVREKERAAALAEVNKIRTDKKVSTPEMIVLLPSSLDAGLKVQVETMLDGLSVEHKSWESPVGDAVKWRRKVTSRFDEEMGRWEPLPFRIQSENHALIILAADELVDMALNDGLDSSIEQTKTHFPGHQIIYLLEGVTAWMRKNRNIRNRQFASGVRSRGAANTTTSSRGRRRNNAGKEHISEDLIEDAMLRLQVEHGVLIHHTAIPLETAQWIVAFTQHISTIPYKKQKDQATATAGFCMESGQVKTGDDVRDTYVKMMQEIARVTAPIAYGIAAEFDSVSKLVSGLEAGGPFTLEGVRKSANKDGVVSDRAVGQAVSKRIYKVFTERDEMSTDV